MRAAVLKAPGLFEIREVPLPQPGPKQVRVKIEYCGICSSNMAPWKGAPWFSYPFEPGAPGHEAVGTVDACGNGANRLSQGQRVAMLSGGGFAEYNVVNEDCAVAIGGLPFPFLGEPVGCAVNVYRRAGILKGQWVAIIGIGFLGAVVLQLAVGTGAKVIAISRREALLKIQRAFELAEQKPDGFVKAIVQMP